MTVITFGINVILAMILYFGNGLLGKLKSDSNGLFKYDAFSFDEVSSANFAEHFFQKIIHPAIYLAIVSALLQHFSFENIARDLWLVIPIFWLFRFFHIIIWNLSGFTNWKYEFTSMIISMVLGEGTLFLILRPLIDSGETVFIDLKQFRDAFWFAAFSYLAKLIWDISKATLTGYNVFPASKRAKTIEKRYYKFRWKYDASIKVILRDRYSFTDESIKDHFLCMLYSIMIYEDHCRPIAVRTMEYIVKLFRRKSTMSLGIMQVQTTDFIGNRKSIELAIDKLYKAYSPATGPDRIYNAVTDYNLGSEYYRQVYSIYCTLSEILYLPELDYQE